MVTVNKGPEDPGAEKEEGKVIVGYRFQITFLLGSLI